MNFTRLAQMADRLTAAPEQLRRMGLAFPNDPWFAEEIQEVATMIETVIPQLTRHKANAYAKVNGVDFVEALEAVSPRGRKHHVYNVGVKDTKPPSRPSLAELEAEQRDLMSRLEQLEARGGSGLSNSEECWEKAMNYVRENEGATFEEAAAAVGFSMNSPMPYDRQPEAEFEAAADDDTFEQALQYMRESGESWEESMAHVATATQYARQGTRPGARIHSDYAPSNRAAPFDGATRYAAVHGERTDMATDLCVRTTIAMPDAMRVVERARSSGQSVADAFKQTCPAGWEMAPADFKRDLLTWFVG